MAAVLFASHNDDETLFAFYQCLRRKPLVVVVLRSFKQWTQQNGPSYTVRERETAAAMEIAECDWEQWIWPDTNPDWVLISREIETYLTSGRFDTVIAPAWELGGHEDHNTLASIVNGIETDAQKVWYLTYQRGRGRSRGVEVAASARELDAKRLALNCYVSQRNHPATADWFPGGRLATEGEWLG